MAKRYVINSILIVLSILLLGTLFLPFYNAVFDGLYGTYSLSGNVAISAVNFAFGLPFSFFNIGSTGSFVNRDYTVNQEIVLILLIVIDVVVFVSSISSICIKQKGSVFFFLFNIIVGLFAIGGGIFSYFSLDIMNVSLSSFKGFISEGIGYGAILNFSLSIVYFILAITLSIISLYDYRMSLKYQNNTPRFNGNIDFSTNYGAIEEKKAKKAIEEKKEPKLLFARKEKVLEVKEIEEVHHENKEIKKDEPVITRADSSFDEKMKHLEDLYNAGTIGSDEYYKIRAAYMKQKEGK